MSSSSPSLPLLYYFSTTLFNIMLHIAASTVSEYEIQEAAEKFEDSKQLAESAMINLFDNEVSTNMHLFVPASQSVEQSVIIAAKQHTCFKGCPWLCIRIMESHSYALFCSISPPWQSFTSCTVFHLCEFCTECVNSLVVWRSL